MRMSAGFEFDLKLSSLNWTSSPLLVHAKALYFGPCQIIACAGAKPVYSVWQGGLWQLTEWTRFTHVYELFQQPTGTGDWSVEKNRWQSVIKCALAITWSMRIGREISLTQMWSNRERIWHLHILSMWDLTVWTKFKCSNEGRWALPAASWGFVVGAMGAWRGVCLQSRYRPRHLGCITMSQMEPPDRPSRPRHRARAAARSPCHRARFLGMKTL